MPDTPLAWLIHLTLCMLLGATGQAARVIVGIKKSRDVAAARGESFADVFDPGALIVSLLIGAVAGVLAGLAVGKQITGVDIAVGIVGAGYAGADFIEGFMKRETPAEQGPKPAVQEHADVQPVG